jgi:hypothetical protein
LARCQNGGVIASCFLSFSISLPIVLRLGSKEINNQVSKEIITGKKIMCLAVTEVINYS